MSEELRNKQEEAALWRALTDSQGWRQLQQVMEAQRSSRIAMVGEAPLTSFAGALPQEFMKGEAAGIGLVLKLPYVQMEVLAADIQVLTYKLEQEKENVAQETADADGRSRSRVELRVGEQWAGE